VLILAALQAIYKKATLRGRILRLIARDVHGSSASNHGREGLSYWEILVLAAVRLGCNLDYDRLQDLAENHRKLRHIMGIGDWDEQRSFSWRRIRDNICLLKPETIAAISDLVVAEGHRLNPEGATQARADSFVVETNIHFPTESSLLYDGLRKIIILCTQIANDLELSGWRQAKHLVKKIKKLDRNISSASRSKDPRKKKASEQLYRVLLKDTAKVLERAEVLLKQAECGSDSLLPLCGELPVFIERTRQVASTAYRRVILGEKVPNAEKLFSMFETHTQLYRRRKAAQENQFGRLVLVYEDGAGFITHHHVMTRDARDATVVVKQTRRVQDKLGGAIERISFDRGFDDPENYLKLLEIVKHVCLPKRSPKQFMRQLKNASEKFLEAHQSHAGVEAAISCVQSGNGLKRCRDRSETGFKRYVSLAILGRNLHVLGKLLIAQQSPDSNAAESRRKSVA